MSKVIPKDLLGKIIVKTSDTSQDGVLGTLIKMADGSLWSIVQLPGRSEWEGYNFSNNKVYRGNSKKEVLELITK